MPDSSNIYPIDNARQIRQERSALLGRLERGEINLVKLLQKPPACIRGTHLYDVLRSAPGLGPQGVRQVCEAAIVWPHLALGEVTEAQKQRVIDNLPKRAR